MNKLIPLIVLSCLLPLAANARTITATGDTDHARAKSASAAREGATTHRITSANGQQSAYHGEKSRTKAPASGSGMSCRQPARQVRRSFFPVDDRCPAARHTGERIPV